MRLTQEQIEKIKTKYNTDKLWSWSVVNTFLISPYEYFLKYIRKEKPDNDNCVYAPLGNCCHDIIEKFYSDKIEHKEMIELFNNSWLSDVTIADLKFNRNNDESNACIANKYKENLQHFFTHHEKLPYKLLLEKFITADISGNIFQGYIDAVYKDNNGCYNIIDWKTSSKYTGKTAEEKAGQLVLYAIGLNQKGIPLDKIKIKFDFLKYVAVSYKQKNGKTKIKYPERRSIGESLQLNAEMWLKECGYGDKIPEYITSLIEKNDISVLPKEIQDMYIIDDCFIEVPLTKELVNYWKKKITDIINDISYRLQEYNSSYNDKIFYDTEDSIKTQSYYFSTLCGYSPTLHIPYKNYLDSLESKSIGIDLLGKTENVNSLAVNNDLSWLNGIV